MIEKVSGVFSITKKQRTNKLTVPDAFSPSRRSRFATPRGKKSASFESEDSRGLNDLPSEQKITVLKAVFLLLNGR